MSSFQDILCSSQQMNMSCNGGEPSDEREEAYTQAYQALPSHIVVDTEILQKLRREIIQRIDQRHNEMLTVHGQWFDQTRAEMFQFRGETLGKLHQVSQPPVQGYFNQPHMTIPKGYGKGHLKGGNSPNSPVPNDTIHGPTQKSPPPEPGVGEAEPENTRTSGLKVNRPPSKRRDPNETENQQTSKSTPDPKKDETELGKIGEPIGEFKGRANLWAFMQVKDWDSDASQTPDAEIIMKEDTQNLTCWGKFRSGVSSTAFDMVIGLAIMVNSITMGLQLEYQGIHSAHTIGVKSDDGNWPNADKAFGVLEHIFAIFFLIELILRVSVNGKEYFKSTFNLLDVFVVVSSLFQLYISPLLQQQSGIGNISFLRLVRVFKIIRILRVFRVIRIFHKLRQFVAAFNHSIASLVWSVLLLSLVQMIAAIFMTQSLQSFLQDENADPEERAHVYKYFGSFSRSCITIFEITLAPGSWNKCGRDVIFSVSRYYALFFIGYLALVSFAMIRVITAMFLKDTLASAAKDSELTMAERNRDPQFVKKLWHLFNAFDVSQKGSLDFHELYSMLEDQTTCKYFKSIGIAPHEVTGLFTLMDDGDNTLGFCEFLTGIMRLQQVGKGVDLPTLLYENKKLLSKMVDIGSQVDEVRKDLSLLRQ